jgi:hypothetical protein
MIKRGILALMLLSTSAVGNAANDDIYIEFLWSKTPQGALARQETRQFLSEGEHDPQICVAANAAPTEVGGLQLELLDANGIRVWQQSYPDYRGSKRCYRAELDQRAASGMWTAQVWLGDGRSGSRQIRVDRRIEDSPYYLERSVPYVAGRPNYDASIPSAEWVGHVAWLMKVDPQGRVTAVEIESAEGVGERLRDRVVAAGYLSLFPPDPERVSTPLRAQRSLSFAAE